MSGFLLMTAALYMSLVDLESLPHVLEPISRFGSGSSATRTYGWEGFRLLEVGEGANAGDDLTMGGATRSPREPSPTLYSSEEEGIAALYSGHLASPRGSVLGGNWRGFNISALPVYGEFGLVFLNPRKGEIFVAADESGAVPVYWAAVGVDLVVSTHRRAVERVAGLFPAQQEEALSSSKKIIPGTAVRLYTAREGEWSMGDIYRFTTQEKIPPEVLNFDSIKDLIRSYAPRDGVSKVAILGDGSMRSCLLECAVKAAGVPYAVYLPPDADAAGGAEETEMPPASTEKEEKEAERPGTKRVTVPIGNEGLVVEREIYKLYHAEGGDTPTLRGVQTAAVAWNARLDGLRLAFDNCEDTSECASLWELWGLSGIQVKFPLLSILAEGNEKELYAQGNCDLTCLGDRSQNLREKFHAMVGQGDLLGSLKLLRDSRDDERAYSLEPYKLLHQCSLPGDAWFQALSALKSRVGIADVEEQILSTVSLYSRDKSDSRWAEIATYLHANLLHLLQRESDAQLVLLRIYASRPKVAFPPILESPQEIQGKESIKIMTVASSWKDQLNDLQDSAEAAGVSFTILGMNEPYPANGQKIVKYLEYVSGLPPWQLVVAIDAYDVLLNPSIVEAPRIFADLTGRADGSEGARIVFAAEEGLYPDLGARGLYPKATEVGDGVSERKYPYLNSGTFMGRAGDLAVMLKELISYSSMPTTCDQRGSTRFFLNHSKEVVLDYNQRLFKPLYNCPYPIVAESPDGRLTIQGESVPVLHFNARLAKEMLESVIRARAAARKEENWTVSVAPHPFAAGMGFYGMGDLDGAALAFAEAAVKEPGNIEAWNNLGHVELKRGHLTEAGLAYSTALTLDPRYKNAQAGMAVVDKMKLEAAEEQR